MYCKKNIQLIYTCRSHRAHKSYTNHIYSLISFGLQFFVHIFRNLHNDLKLITISLQQNKILQF